MAGLSLVAVSRAAVAVPVVYDITFSDPKLSGMITFDDDDFNSSPNIPALDFSIVWAQTGASWDPMDKELFAASGQVGLTGDDVASFTLKYKDDVLPGVSLATLTVGMIGTWQIEDLFETVLATGNYELARSTVPQPATGTLVALGLAALAVRRRARPVRRQPAGLCVTAP